MSQFREKEKPKPQNLQMTVFHDRAPTFLFPLNAFLLSKVAWPPASSYCLWRLSDNIHWTITTWQQDCSWNFATLHEPVLHYSISPSDFLLSLCVAVLLGAFPILLHVNKAMSTLQEIKSSLYILWFDLLWNINVERLFSILFRSTHKSLRVESKEAPWACMTLEYDNQLHLIRPKSLSCSTNAFHY